MMNSHCALLYVHVDVVQRLGLALPVAVGLHEAPALHGVHGQPGVLQHGSGHQVVCGWYVRRLLLLLLLVVWVHRHRLSAAVVLLDVMELQLRERLLVVGVRVLYHTRVWQRREDHPSPAVGHDGHVVHRLEGGVRVRGLAVVGRRAAYAVIGPASRGPGRPVPVHVRVVSSVRVGVTHGPRLSHKVHSTTSFMSLLTSLFNALQQFKQKRF